MSLKTLLKPICPFFFYQRYENRKRLRRVAGINSADKFSGKIFCIGFNKTGTTSVQQVLSDFGYRLGSQTIAAMLLPDWYQQKYDRLIRFCRTAEAFQDIPFSLPQTYRILDNTFSHAKFILTVRDSPYQWYHSMLRFHKKIYSCAQKRLPDENDLEGSTFPYSGYALDIMKMVFNYPAVELYDYAYYTELYQRHNQDVHDYFKDKPDKCIVINVAQADAYSKLAAFLNVQVPEDRGFPWKNKT